MASTVTTELPSLQSREVDFVGSRPSPGRRSSVDADEDNQSEGTVSEVDPTEDDVAGGSVPQTSWSPAGSAEAGGTAVSRSRGLGVSQYHSISELSSPSAAASTTTTMAAFCVQPSSSSFDFAAQQLYGRSAGDSVHVLRGMFYGHAGQRDRLEHNGDADVSDADDNVDDDEEWTTDQAEMMRDRMACDDEEFNFCGSPRHSVNISTSSGDDLSGDDEGQGPHDLRTKPTDDVGGNGVPSSSGSDSGSAGDDVIEAKRARMESIVTNMRPSLQLSSGDRTATNGTESGFGDRTSFGGKEDDPKRRPKRKQYIPKQHEASSGVESPGNQQQLDSGEETPTVVDRKSLLPAAEKMALDAELRGVNEQLNYIRRKYAHLFDDAQQVTAGYFTTKNANDYSDVSCRTGNWRENSWSQAFHDAFSKHASSEWKKFLTAADGGLTSAAVHCVPKQESNGAAGRERYGVAMQSSPIAGDTPVDVRRLADMLKMEITERFESLVNEIIRNFVTKYGLATAGDRSLPDTATESKFKPETREKLPEVAVRHTDAVTSCSVAYAEDLSPGRDGDDADRKPELTSTSSAASFLSVPSLLLPTPKRPTTAATVEESTPGGKARSPSDEDSHAVESLDRQSRSSADIPLSSSDQTAFEIPPRTAHHPLYSLFAPHAPYYPNASRMAAAAAAAAAAVAANGAYAPVPPVASSILFPPCREPEQTEALPLVVNTPTKKKRTKVTDTRLSPRAARSILHDGGGHRHHHAGSYHGAPHHHHSRPDSSHHRVHYSGGPRVTDDAATERRRLSPVRSSTDSGLVSPFLHSRHPSAGLPPMPLLPASLPTSVAVPNPSLQHSDIMTAIFQFSQQRAQQQQQVDSTQPQRFAPPLPSPFVDKFDFKQLVGDTHTSASDGLHGSLPSARKAAESNGTDGYESIFHEDGLVSFTMCTVKLCVRILAR